VINPFEVQLKALIKFLSEQKIKYIILGGIAVSIYGEPRFTSDIDVNIIFDKKKINEFLEGAKKYGFYPDVKNIVKEPGVIPMNFIKGKITGGFDIIIAENMLEYTAIERGRVKKMGSVKVRLVSPEDLIIHKIASFRPRDIEDVNGILIRQKGKLDINYIRSWLKKIDKANRNSRTYKTFNSLLKKLG
jgi:predicted nucleotidyltransferase